MLSLNYDSSYDNEPIGGDNPYYMCSCCHIADPQINGFIFNHSSDCSYLARFLKSSLNENDFNFYSESIINEIKSLTYSEVESCKADASRELTKRISTVSGFSIIQIKECMNKYGFDPLLIMGYLRHESFAVKIKGDREKWNFRSAQQWANENTSYLSKIYY
jgi:hypothetical protein